MERNIIRLNPVSVIYALEHGCTCEKWEDRHDGHATSISYMLDGKERRAYVWPTQWYFENKNCPVHGEDALTVEDYHLIDPKNLEWLRLWVGDDRAKIRVQDDGSEVLVVLTPRGWTIGAPGAHAVFRTLENHFWVGIPDENGEIALRHIFAFED